MNAGKCNEHGFGLSFRPGARLAAFMSLFASGYAFAQAESPTWMISAERSAAIPFVNITSTTSPRAAAIALASRPAGERVVSLSGFANGLAQAENLKIARTVKVSPRSKLMNPAAISLPNSVVSPWLGKGTAIVKKRTDSWLRSYVAAGGPKLDMVVASDRVPISAADYWRTNAYGGWGAVCADTRFPTITSAIGIPNLATSLLRSEAARSAWDKYQDALARQAVDAAVLAPFRAQFPAIFAGMGLPPVEVPTTLGEARALSTVVAGNTSFIRLVPRSDVDLSSLNAMKATIPMANVPVRQALFVSTLPDTANDSERRAWSEYVCHACVISGTTIVGGGSSRQTMDLAGAIVAEAKAVGVRADLSSRPARPQFDQQALAVSGGDYGGVTVWRVSCPTNVTSIQFKFVNGATESVSSTTGSAGIWYSHPKSQQLLSVEQVRDTPVVRGNATSRPPVLYDMTYDMAGSLPVTTDAQKYLIVYQTSVDTASMSTGRIDSSKVVANIRQQLVLDHNYSWGVLDFEVPFDDVLEAGPSHPLHSTVIASLTETIREVKRNFPGIRWTYYNMPRVRYWVDGQDWGALTPTARANVMDRVLNSYGLLMAEMDWFNPSVYDQYEAVIGMPPSTSAPAVAERAFRTASVELVRRWFLNQQARYIPPVIPMVSRWFQPGGEATFLREVPLGEFIEDQVRPCIEAGADSVALWGCMSYFVHIAFLPPEQVPDYAVHDRAQMRIVLSNDFGVTSNDLPTTDGPSVATDRQQALQRLKASQTEALAWIASLRQLTTH